MSGAVRRIAVVYDLGSLAPTRIAEAATRVPAELVFVVADTEHAREMAPVLALLGATVDGAGGPDGVVDRLRAASPDGIVTFSERQIATTARLADALGLRYHRPEDLGPIIHKDEQRARFTAAGVDCVRHRTVTAPEQAVEAFAAVGPEVILKPVAGASSRNTVAVSTAEACATELGRMLRPNGRGAPERAVLVEELLVGRASPAPWGDYVAVDVVADDEGVRPLFVTSKFTLAEPFRERGGYGARSVLPPDEVREAEELACRAVGALRIYGVADVEIKLTSAGPRVIEVNGRLGAWVDDLAVRSGVADPATVALRVALGERPPLGPAAGGAGPIAFHYVLVPSADARRVRSISDVAALRAVPGVERVVVLVEPGADVGWWRGADANVAAVTGIAATHDELARTVAALDDARWIAYDR